MPIKPKTRKQRHKKLGSSDMAALFGLDPYQTEADIYANKTCQLAEREPTDGMIAGTFLEDGILNWSSLTLGPLIRNQRRVDGILAANIDAIVRDTGEPVEAKGSFRPTDEYGAEGTDEVPAHVIIQCHVHMICQPAEVCHVPVFRNGRLMMYHVPRNAGIIDAIRERAVSFWEEHVKPRVPPEPSTPSLDILKRLVRVPEKIVQIDAAIAAQWRDLRQTRLDAEKAEEDAYRQVLDALGDAEVGEYEGGILTYLTQRGADKVDRAALRRDGHTQYLSDNAYRVLRIKENK